MKDPKIISKKFVKIGTDKILRFGVGETLGQIDEVVEYEELKQRIRNGEQYQTQSYGDADPANVIVREDGYISTGKDGTPLNNIKGANLAIEYVQE
jgi:hypothetical protein